MNSTMITPVIEPEYNIYFRNIGNFNYFKIRDSLEFKMIT